MGLGSDSDGAGGSVFAGAVRGEGSDHRPGSIQGAAEGELLNPQWVLRQIDLDIAPGMTLALVGPSGALR
jgi:ABC-type multidrug transport system fused ATPase/permease subunit